MKLINGIEFTNKDISNLATRIMNKRITVHPNGEDEKGRHLYLEDGETPKEAMKRQWGVDLDKKTKKQSSPKQDFDDSDKALDEINSKIDELYKQQSKDIDVNELKDLISTREHLLKVQKDTQDKRISVMNDKIKNFISDRESKELALKLDAELSGIPDSHKKIFDDVTKKFDDQIQSQKDEWWKIFNEKGNGAECKSIWKKEQKLQKEKENYQKEQLTKLYDKVSAVIRTENGGELSIGKTTPTNKLEAKRVQTLLSGVIDKSVMPKKGVDFEHTGANRVYFSEGENTVRLGTGTKTATTLHETMHWLEHNNARIAKNSRDFLAYRTKGEEAQKMSELTGNKRYKSSEVAKKDRFFSPYCGKIYESGATEIMSMGLQRIF